MPHCLRYLALACIGAGCATATWSLGVVDPKTRTIAVAAASCTPSVYGVAGVVPGKGFVFAQAASNMEAKAAAMNAIREGRSPVEIIRAIANAGFDSDWEEQQYAVVTLAHIDQPASFTGNKTRDVRGARAGKGISVQGNMVVRAEVLQSAFDRLYRATWRDDRELAAAALAALAEGSKQGGDRRCGAATASSAFLTVVRAEDGSTPYLNLVVRRGETSGGNAVALLEKRFAHWLA